MDTSLPEQIRYSYLYRKEDDGLYVVTIPALKYKGMFEAVDEETLRIRVYSKVRHLLTLIALRGEPFPANEQPSGFKIDMRPQAWGLAFVNAKLVRDEAVGDSLASYVEKKQVVPFLLSRVGEFLNEIEGNNHSAKNYAEIIDTLYYLAKLQGTTKNDIEGCRKKLKKTLGGLGDHNIVITSRWNDNGILKHPATVYETDGPDTYIVVKEGLACSHYLWKNPEKGGDHSICKWLPFPNWPTLLKTQGGEKYSQLRDRVLVKGVVPFFI